MNDRKVVLDTETTGMRVEEGNRIIEIGCLEMIDRQLTGKHFHCYLNPDRDIEAGAQAVHGISIDDLKSKPRFENIVDEFLDFVSGAELIIHNAPFDLAFLNYEISLFNKAKAMRNAPEQSLKKISHYCEIIDTLVMARKKHVGQRNSLDALCKRYKVDNSKRELHGALLDAHLLAKVYLAMTGGQGSFFDSDLSVIESNQKAQQPNYLPTNHSLKVLKANDEELKAHSDYLEMMQKKGKCLWFDD